MDSTLSWIAILMCFASIIVHLIWFSLHPSKSEQKRVLSTDQDLEDGSLIADGTEPHRFEELSKPPRPEEVIPRLFDDESLAQEQTDENKTRLADQHLVCTEWEDMDERLYHEEQAIKLKFRNKRRGRSVDR